MATRSNAQFGLCRLRGLIGRCFGGVGLIRAALPRRWVSIQGLAYFEWSAADDCDVTDPQEWWGFHPALGHTIELATIQADLRRCHCRSSAAAIAISGYRIRMQPVGPSSVVMLGGRLRSDMAKPKYGGAHQKLRRAMLPVAVGAACVRCGLVIVPGQPVDLDHLDDGSGRMAAGRTAIAIGVPVRRWGTYAGREEDEEEGEISAGEVLSGDSD